MNFISTVLDGQAQRLVSRCGSVVSATHAKTTNAGGEAYTRKGSPPASRGQHYSNLPPGPKDPRPYGCICGDCRNPRCPLHTKPPSETSSVKSPEPIVIPLTSEQAEQLKEHFEFVGAEAARGWRGMLVAQVWAELAEAGNQPALRVGFIPYDKAKLLQRSAK